MHNTRTGHMYSVIYLPQYSPRVFSTNLLKCTLNYFDILRKGQRSDMLGLEVAKNFLVCKQCGFQGGINCEASPQADFIMNHVLSNSPIPPSPAGRLEQLMPP